MKIKFTTSFRDKLNEQIEFIATDKPSAARDFKKEVLKRIKEIPSMPYKHRKSIFFNRKDIRDLIYLGYVIIYMVDEGKNRIIVFGFTKYQENPFKK